MITHNFVLQSALHIYGLLIFKLVFKILLLIGWGVGWLLLDGRFSKATVRLTLVIDVNITANYLTYLAPSLFSGHQFVKEQYSEHERSSKPQFTARD